MTTDGDVWYQDTLGDKAYMMGVSPYFYTGKSAQAQQNRSHG